MTKNNNTTEIQHMSLEEKLLRLKLSMHDVTLTPLQIECVLDAMKEVTTQRKLGNWSDKII